MRPTAWLPTSGVDLRMDSLAALFRIECVSILAFLGGGGALDGAGCGRSGSPGTRAVI